MIKWDSRVYIEEGVELFEQGSLQHGLVWIFLCICALIIGHTSRLRVSTTSKEMTDELDFQQEQGEDNISRGSSHQPARLESEDPTKLGDLCGKAQKGEAHRPHGTSLFT